jgi:hypothetical protein
MALLGFNKRTGSCMLAFVLERLTYWIDHALVMNESVWEGERTLLRAVA